MTRPALDCPRPASAPDAPVAPVFFNFRSQVVRPVCFAIVYWDGPGDTLYAFEDRNAFERQRTTAERYLVNVHELSVDEAADWIAAGGSAVLHEVSVAGVAAFGNLKLAPDYRPGARRLHRSRGKEGLEKGGLPGLGERPAGLSFLALDRVSHEHRSFPRHKYCHRLARSHR